MLRGGGTLKLLDEMSLAVYSRGQSLGGSPDTQAPGNTNDKEGIVAEEDLARNSNSAIFNNHLIRSRCEEHSAIIIFHPL